MILPDPLRHDCRHDYPAYHHEGERLLSSIRYVVLHSTEAPNTATRSSAESTARYFMSPQSGGSANLVVDWARCYRCLGDNVIPWGAPPLNTHGFHIEMAGYAAWTRKRWLMPLNRRTIKRAAYKASLRCKWYKIPVRILDAPALIKDYGQTFQDTFQRGALHGGITTHRTIDAAFHQSTHTDPGAGFPLDVFLADVQGFLA